MPSISSQLIAALDAFMASYSRAAEAGQKAGALLSGLATLPEADQPDELDDVLRENLQKLRDGFRLAPSLNPTLFRTLLELRQAIADTPEATPETGQTRPLPSSHQAQDAAWPLEHSPNKPSQEEVVEFLQEAAGYYALISGIGAKQRRISGAKTNLYLSPSWGGPFRWATICHLMDGRVFLRRPYESQIAKAGVALFYQFSFVHPDPGWARRIADKLNAYFGHRLAWDPSVQALASLNASQFEALEPEVTGRARSGHTREERTVWLTLKGLFHSGHLNRRGIAIRSELPEEERHKTTYSDFELTWETDHWVIGGSQGAGKPTEKARSILQKALWLNSEKSDPIPALETAPEWVILRERAMEGDPASLGRLMALARTSYPALVSALFLADGRNPELSARIIRMDTSHFAGRCEDDPLAVEALHLLAGAGNQAAVEQLRKANPAKYVARLSGDPGMIEQSEGALAVFAEWNNRHVAQILLQAIEQDRLRQGSTLKEWRVLRQMAENHPAIALGLMGQAAGNRNARFVLANVDTVTFKNQAVHDALAVSAIARFAVQTDFPAQNILHSATMTPVKSLVDRIRSLKGHPGSAQLERALVGDLRTLDQKGNRNAKQALSEGKYRERMEHSGRASVRSGVRRAGPSGTFGLKR